jgi:hypothetical protein
MATLIGSTARFFVHPTVVAAAIYGISEMNFGTTESIAGFATLLGIFAIAGWAILELMRLPVDIYNFVMAAFSNDLELSKWSMVINGIYMAANLVAIVSMTVFTVGNIAQAAEKYALGYSSWEELGETVLLFLALAAPNMLLLFTQVNAFLYIYMSNEGVDLLSDVIFA